MARYNKIYAGPVTETLPQVVEGPAATALTPGEIVTKTSNGKLTLHAVSGGGGAVLVVQENYLAMKGVDVDIAADDVAIGIVPLDEQLLRVRVATANNVVIGSPLSSNGDGTVSIAATGEEVLFFAEEAYNNTSGSAQLVTVRKGKGVAA